MPRIWICDYSIVKARMLGLIIFFDDFTGYPIYSRCFSSGCLSQIQIIPVSKYLSHIFLHLLLLLLLLSVRDLLVYYHINLFNQCIYYFYGFCIYFFLSLKKEKKGIIVVILPLPSLMLHVVSWTFGWIDYFHPCTIFLWCFS